VRVVVDFETCRSNAICMGFVPEVFEVRDDGFLHVLDESPPESLRSRLEQAALECPTQSITLED
jgi:ferredoxin